MSTQAASLRTMQAPQTPTLPKVPLPTPVDFTPPPLPTAPQLPVINPTTAAQESFIKTQLDPTQASWIGNKYQDTIQKAGAELQLGLHGYGDYNYTPGPLGTVNPEQAQGQGGDIGEKYRHDTIAALAQANARGMLNSRMADEAVGQAWSRLNDQKRDFFNRYGTAVSGALQGLSQEYSTLNSNLLTLYGDDVDYALKNPIIPETPAAAGGGGG